MGVPEQSKISNATRSEPPRLRRWGYWSSLVREVVFNLAYISIKTGVIYL
eukprot:COSAG06_NODE_64331_length_257_cov_606.393750_1_plen_49_part_10